MPRTRNRFARRCATAVALAVAVLAVAPADVARAEGPPPRKEPYVGYVFPAGGRQGTTFRIVAGGLNLAAVNGVHVTGEGVRATLVRYEGALRRLNGDQRKEFRRRVDEQRRKLREEAAGASAGAAPAAREPVAAEPARKADGKPDRTELPDIAPFRDIEKMGPADLDRIEARFMRDDPKRQPNAQIGEMALLEVTIDAGTPSSDRELRLVTRIGLSNPVRFVVGSLPEVVEEEPVGARAPAAALLVPPVLVNGQVLPGDVDRHGLYARRGQRLVIEAQARRLIPYLADAVPGWFQARMSLRDESGAEVAFADDYRFDPDPVLFCEIPKDGTYTLEISDAIYRGREDFVYRVSIAEAPFITRLFPLGGKAGTGTVASVAGWNLPCDSVKLDTRPGEDDVRWTGVQQGDQASNRVPYAVDSLPLCQEAEPNDGIAAAQRIAPAQIVDGRIGRPGDTDVFAFDGHAGTDVVAEVFARRLGSPVDSVLRLTDAAGGVIEWNDDREDKLSGLLTHHADSYLRARLPADGTYFVRLADVQSHGGDEYAYRLRVGWPRPDFAAVVTPSSVNVPAGRAAPVWVHVVRRDGFDGDVDLALVDPPAGFKLDGAQVPRGRDKVRVTLTAPPIAFDRPVALRMAARARIGGRDVGREVVPAQDMMQAFAYRHLAASQELMVAVLGQAGATPSYDLVSGTRVRIPAGGLTHLKVLAASRAQRPSVALSLDEPPAGVTVGDVTPIQGGWDVVLRADATAVVGLADNLVFEAFTEAPGSKEDVAAGKPPRRNSVGYLPALPIEIVKN
jgi:hypothetical protein